MKKIKVIRQLQPNECGLCCCKMVLDYYGCNVELRDIRNDIGSIRDGVNIFHIKEYFKKFNYQAKVLKIKTENIVEALKHVKLPSILFWENKHFVVLEKIKNNHYFIVDPELGRKTYSETELLHKFSNILLEVNELENSIKTPKIKFRKKWNFFISSLKSSTGKIVLSLLLSIFMYLVTIFSAEYSKRLINSITSVAQHGNTEEYLTLFSNFSMVLLLFLILVFVIAFIRELISLSLRVDTEKKIVSDAFKKTLKLPYSFFESRTNGELLTSLGSVNVLKDFLLDKFIKMYFDIGLFIVLIGYVFSISVKLFFVHIIFLILNQTLIYSLSHKIRELSQQEFTLNSLSNSIQIQTLHSVQLTKVMRSEDDIYSKWKQVFSELQKIRKRKQFYQGLISTFVNTMNIVIPLVLLLVGFLLVIYQEVTLGEIIIAQTFTVMSISLISQVINTYSEYLVNSSFIERINDIVLHPEEEDGHKEIGEIKTIEVRNLNFSYTKDSNLILKNINLQIHCGEKIAIVGSTGSGKSTLIKLLAGLYREKDLPIYYNGIPIHEINTASLSKQVSCVLQDMHIYSDTIFENIRAQRYSFTEEDVVKAAEAACLDQDISRFPMGYYTVPTDSGVDLSGGQRQRIAIARAILNQPTVLIFDEGTSYLDYTTERKIMNNILSQDNISIIVAHRLETIKNCDRIFLIENGEIVEHGTHDDLIEKMGKYHYLYSS
ncbi:peptidase domain-containing ABC transporter [Paenibacillus faecalis]|uniref:peptidase domain-containing ABC transporter n=1 Tax=Paenibacillus faecalis TaxID=2079532 RepID=UPI00131A5902|nr:peptidase domain-containing ABC transporter [Paenibacillus faecalis]